VHFPNNSVIFSNEQRHTIEEFLAEWCFGFEAQFDESAVTVFPKVCSDAILLDFTFLNTRMNADSPECSKITAIGLKMIAGR